MNQNYQKTNLDWLIETYFSNPDQRFKLTKGEVLMNQGGFNDRLYLVRQGSLAACVNLPDGEQFKLFKAIQNMFVGVYSFFSKTFVSSATVVAEEESEVAFIDHHQPVINRRMGVCLFDQFMPVVVTDLALRQQRELLNAFEKEKALKKLIESEKFASLGQMAAGIAHELNNAISVLERNTVWLREQILSILEQKEQTGIEFFKTGLAEGRRLSTREVRQKSKVLKNKHSLPDEQARQLAETGIAVETLNLQASRLMEIAGKVYYFWELGATFRDMEIAAQHASHVVRSVKNLATHSRTESNIDVNESINEALALLSSPLRKVNVKLALQELPKIPANKGDLVQVWTNLIKNALESMSQANLTNQQLKIESTSSAHFIMVKIQDNGPGIPNELLSQIFQPNFTTKEKGLNFGLGLGLTIAARIINDYRGEIIVSSVPGKTIFTVKIPTRGDHATVENYLY